MGSVYTPAQQRAFKKYYNNPEVKERVSWSGKDRCVNDEEFRERKRNQALLNYYTRKERKQKEAETQQ